MYIREHAYRANTGSDPKDKSCPGEKTLLHTFPRWVMISKMIPIVFYNINYDNNGWI
jgi:hypothetical protein